MKKLLLSIVLLLALTEPTLAVGQGAYSVYCDTNYYNPDTNLIEDGGTANAALGDGMCRSATATSALVEFDGTNYYVTIRLLLQSNTKDVIFYRHTGYDTYEQVAYEIMLEDGATDAIDYRFQVLDPFAPIKASMYVTPMGRATVWFIELDETSLSADTGDFVVSVATVVAEEEPPVVEEPDDAVGNGLDHSAHEEESLVDELSVGDGLLDVPTPESETEIEAMPEPTEESIVGDDAHIVPPPETEETTEEIAAPQQSTSYTPYILVAMLTVIGCVMFAVKKGKKA